MTVIHLFIQHLSPEEISSSVLNERKDKIAVETRTKIEYRQEINKAKNEHSIRKGIL